MRQISIFYAVFETARNALPGTVSGNFLPHFVLFQGRAQAVFTDTERTIMNYETFKETIVTGLEEKLPEGKRVRRMPVTKLNGTGLDALVIESDSSEIHPTLYFNDLFAALNSGHETIESLIDGLASVAASPCGISGITSDLLKDYENVKDRICCRIINTGRNEEMLSGVPHVDFLDLSVVFYILMETDGGHCQSMITESLMNEWDVHISSLLPAACENTKRLNASQECGLVDAVNSFFKDDSDFMCASSDDPAQRVYVISGQSGMNGAIHMLDFSMLSKYAELFDGDVLIIPSSIHEILLAPASLFSREKMDEIIQEINRSSVRQTEFLSDHSYVYLRDKKEIIS